MIFWSMKNINERANPRPAVAPIIVFDLGIKLAGVNSIVLDSSNVSDRMSLNK